MEIADNGKSVIIEGLEFSGDEVPIIFLEHCDRNLIMLGLEELKEIKAWAERAIEAEEEERAIMADMELKAADNQPKTIDDIFGAGALDFEPED